MVVPVLVMRVSARAGGRARPRPRRRRRSSPSSIQPPIATIETAATTGAQRTTDVGRRARRRRPTTIAASTRMPTVCDRLTDRPRPSAWQRRPARARRGTPPSASCRGPASARARHPGAAAVSSDEQEDDRRQVGWRKIAGQLAAADAARHGTGDRRRGGATADGAGDAAADGAAVTSRAGGAAGPHGIGVGDVERRQRSGPRRGATTITAASRQRAGDQVLRDRRVSRAETLSVAQLALDGAARRRRTRGPRSRASRAARGTSRRRRRSASGRASSGAASVRLEAARPGASSTGRRRPAGSDSPASIGVELERGSVGRQRAGRARASSHAATRPASISSSDTDPSPSVSKSWRAWKAGSRPGR